MIREEVLRAIVFILIYFPINGLAGNESNASPQFGPPVNALILVNADTDQDIAEINEGDVFLFEDLGTLNLNVRAETGANTESVVFAYQGITGYSIDNNAVYAIGGNSGADYNAWVPDFGANTIKAVAYAGANGSGFDGEPFTVNFEILEEDPSLSAVVRINAGGPTVTYGDSIFIADDFFSGNGNIYANNSISDIFGTTSDEIYKTERSTNADLQSFVYSIPVTNGEYWISLHFAEIFWGATDGGAAGPEKRIFDVILEGQVILLDFDLNAQVSPMTAIIKTFGTNVMDGSLDLKFIASVNEPKISAIEVYGEGSLVTEPVDVFIEDLNITNCPTEPIFVGDVIDLDVEIIPANTTNQTVAFTASDGTSVDNLSGEFTAVSPGEITVTATSLSDGAVLDQCTITILDTIPQVGPPVIALILVNADTDQDIGEINEGDVFYLEIIGTSNLNVRAEVDPNTESVVFDYQGVAGYQIESVPVYAIGGDSGGDYNAWVPDLGANVITATAYDGNSGTGLAGEPLTVSFEFLEDDPTLPAVVRINSGGPTVTYGDSIFIADDFFSGNGNEYENSNIADIIGTTQDEIYKTERSTNQSLQSFSYSIPVTNGEYTINLHFAEIYFGATGGGSGGTGQRVFDVTLEGQNILTDFDINFQVSPMTALVETFTTTVADQSLDLTFSASVNQPKVSAIEVYGEGSLLTDPTDCTWNMLASSSLSKVEAQSVKVNDKLYVLAGFLSGLQITGATEIYDPATNTWTNGAPMPTPVTHMGAVAVGEDIWILAGFVGNHPGVATGLVQIYNTTTDTWSIGPALPNPRGSGAAAYSDGKIHFFGGLLPDRVTDVGEHYVLDVNDQASGWQALADMPEPRNHHSAAAVNGIIYAIGGQYGHDSGVDDQKFLHAYDPLTDSWTQMADLPSDRSHFEPGTMVHNDKIIIVGGRRGGFFFDDVTEYDPATNTWTERCELPSNLLAPAAKVFGDQLIVANGGENGTCCPQNETMSIAIEPEVITGDPVVSGELKKWHKVTVSFLGPQLSETAENNPFADYRLDVTFTNGSETYIVPGYYAADGNAANTSATDGNIWQAHFSPSETGTWTYTASFRTGTDVATSTDLNAGTANSFDGQSGTFDIAASDKTGRDFRNTGRLEYVGEHYLQFAETGDYFFKVGADAPENTFAYEDFDATPNQGNRRKSWAPHAGDFALSDAGEYTWGTTQSDGFGENGRELLGVINYLSDQGMNVFSFLTFSLDGDDDNVYPHLQEINNATSYNDVYHDRFDVSKLAQWEKILEYADKKGVYMHFKTQETENDQKMDGGQLGRERKLYYRELIARFGHHLALNWNLGEENDIWQELGDPNNDLVRSYANYIHQVDPYDHNIVIHTYPGQQDEVYTPLLGTSSELTGVSVQSGIGNIHSDVKNWVEESRLSDKKWVVANDEQGNAQTGVTVDADYPDSQLPEANNSPDNRDAVRHQVLWGTMLAGGSGVEYYYGYQTGCDDLDCQDHRTRQSKWNDAKIALDFFNDYLQNSVVEMLSNDGLTTDNGDYVFAKEGAIYAIYRPNGGGTDLDLSGQIGTFEVKWYDPRIGGSLQDGSVTSIAGGSTVSIGLPPTDPSNDWVALITVEDETDFRVLVYHETNGFRHGSINAGIDMIEEFGIQNSWIVNESQTSAVFNNANLATVDVVVWLNTSGNGLLTDDEQDAFELFIQNGGGFVGFHAATDTYRNGSWPWYNDLVGAIVQTGPNHTSNNFNATMDVVGSHPAVDHLGTEWNKNEEYYYWELNGGYLFDGNIDLLQVRSTGSQSYDAPRPITWYKEYDGGRSFYTALGHNGFDYNSNTDFRIMAEQAILWAGGITEITPPLIGSDSSASESPVNLAQNDFVVFPNPVFDILQVRSRSYDAFEVKLISITGAILLEQRGVFSSSFDMSSFKSGLYILRITQEGTDYRIKIIKE
ncbi:malectin domain-containing carbohydrate-binding protein [Cryomorpha ignava]|uniref:malectin domain-containing carbohydrate-binding protein n=1 Tax=Cryomorpha ignava TaxID=101383 RepID=UPI0019535AF7|nr:malectin domain-containing carbohydrate-binding protein [Cryomorpha ignava]